MTMDKTPFFLTVDTEGDNIWNRPGSITSDNTENLYRFQELCLRYGIKPIYLTNYEAAVNPEFGHFARQYTDQLEIGLHLHAWNSPPLYRLTEDDFYHQPYLHEYPAKIVEEKIAYMVRLLEDTFQTEIVSHRGGRYSISEPIFESLLKHGIRIDCSVVPGVNWGHNLGDPSQNGGPDFTGHPRQIYKIHKELLEVPVSTLNVSNRHVKSMMQYGYVGKVLKRLFNLQNLTLRSRLNNSGDLMKIVNRTVGHKVGHLCYIIHSSELTAGYSPLMRTREEEALFYEHLERFFRFLKSAEVVPMTFKEYLHGAGASR